MKKVIIPMACAVAIGLVACNDTSSTSSSTDSTNSTGAVTVGSSSEGGAPKTSYVDLSSGATVQVKKDSTTGHYINIETNEPLQYYVDPSTADTFDIEGRLVNNALSKGLDGKYMVDESKVKTADGKIKTQSDGDIKIKEGDDKAKLETNGDMKLKTEDGKVKVKGDKTKVKTN